MTRTININWNGLQSVALTIQHLFYLDYFIIPHPRLELTNIFSLTDYCSNLELLAKDKKRLKLEKKIKLHNCYHRH